MWDNLPVVLSPNGLEGKCHVNIHTHCNAGNNNEKSWGSIHNIEPSSGELVHVSTQYGIFQYPIQCVWVVKASIEGETKDIPQTEAPPSAPVPKTTLKRGRENDEITPPAAKIPRLGSLNATKFSQDAQQQQAQPQQLQVQPQQLQLRQSTKKPQNQQLNDQNDEQEKDEQVKFEDEHSISISNVPITKRHKKQE